MNRTFAITGLLAAGMSVFWVWFIFCLPWFPIYNPRSPDVSIWLAWGGASAVGITLIFAFIRYSLTAHWAALRRNAPMPSAAWRGAGGIYLLVMLAFALPALSGDPSGTHQAEMYLYICLAGLGLVLATLAFSRGFRRLA